MVQQIACNTPHRHNFHHQASCAIKARLKLVTFLQDIWVELKMVQTIDWSKSHTDILFNIWVAQLLWWAAKSEIH